MSDIPLLPAIQFRGITAALEDLGLPSERIVTKAGIPQWQFLESTALIPSSHFYRLIKLATGIVGDEDFPLRVADAIPIPSMGILGRTLSQSLCLNDAFRSMVRAYGLVSTSSRYWIAEGEEEIWVCRAHAMGNHPGVRLTEIYTLEFIINIVRCFAGSRWRPGKVMLEGESLPGLERLEPFADAHVQINQGIGAVAIPRSLLSLSPLGAVSPTSSRHLAPSPTEIASTELLVSLRQIVRSLLAFGHPQIEVIAECAGLSVRSLQRRLREQGVTFKKLVDQARFRTAVDLMREPDIKLVEVALDLGYADQAHFSRAFHRWAGVAPGEYRLQQQSH